MSASLRELRGDPFELLLALDRRLRTMRMDAAGGRAEIWQGLAFRYADRWAVTPKDDVREVIPPPRCTRVPNAKPWLAGVSNVRGSLLTLVDLGRLFGGQGAAPNSRTARVLVLNSDRVPVGFLVDEVAGYRQFTVAEQSKPDLSEDDPRAPCVLGGFLREGRAWQVLSLHKLAQSETLRRAGW